VLSANAKLFGAVSLLLGAGAVVWGADFRMLGNNQGYAPEQPIAFSHRLHAGELAMDCQYCHSGARRSRYAGVPPASLCMNCHQTVTAGFDALLTEREAALAEEREPALVVSPELEKLYTALGVDAAGNPLEGVSPTPVEWVRVHNLPDFVSFDHRPHVARGVACETCHGPVQSMDRMRQHAPLTMGWCMDCHRTTGQRGTPGPDAPGARAPQPVPTDCVICHL
jgi:hypothetical protein